MPIYTNDFQTVFKILTVPLKYLTLIQRSYVVYKIGKAEMLWLKVKAGSLESFQATSGRPLRNPTNVVWKPVKKVILLYQQLNL